MTSQSHSTSHNLTQSTKPHSISLNLTQPISRIKGNQIMKFGQFIEYVMSNTFLEKSYAKCSGETIPRPFSKKPKLSIFLGQ